TDSTIISAGRWTSTSSSCSGERKKRRDEVRLRETGRTGRARSRPRLAPISLLPSSLAGARTTKRRADDRAARCAARRRSSARRLHGEKQRRKRDDHTRRLPRRATGPAPPSPLRAPINSENAKKKFEIKKNPSSNKYIRKREGRACPDPRAAQS